MADEKCAAFTRNREGDGARRWRFGTFGHLCFGVRVTSVLRILQTFLQMK